MSTANSVLVVGFNTRPLAYSLNQAGYEVYAVDFFGDLDLFPYVKDSIIIINELDSNYDSAKGIYSEFLAKYSIKLLKKYPKIKYLIIGSGLDDSIEEREAIIKEILKEKYKIIDANNQLETIKKARNIERIHEILKSQGYKVPLTIPFNKFQEEKFNMNYPFILKRKSSSGGINVFKIEDEENFSFIKKKLETQTFNWADWLVQEYIDGNPVSCTTISNGKETEIVSINRQVIGEKLLHPPREFIYCGNVVPANLHGDDEKLIGEVSSCLAKELGLRGINGFDFVLKNHYPFLMEINPRIPGSIRASESSMKLNLLDLHVKSFEANQWDNIKQIIKDAKHDCFATKLIMFSPREIGKESLMQINSLDHVHDKNDPNQKISKGAPICTILFEGKDFSKSYFGALKIVEKIQKIIDNNVN